MLGGMSGIAFANDMLFVADASRFSADPINHRVVVYSGISSKLPRPADPIEQDGSRCPLCKARATFVLGQEDFKKTEFRVPSASSLRRPTAVASDGTVLAVADTDNNRVLIWRTIPHSMNAPADIVVGQADMTGHRGKRPPDNRSLLGPQGVWIQDGRLYVADTQNHRVLVWNRIPTENNAPADLVLGQASFDVAVEPDLTQTGLVPAAKPDNLLNPVSVTSDGVRLYVSDLGHNRVLIWNSIPTRNQQPADVVVGQPDMQSTRANNVQALCAPVGRDEEKDEDIYPMRCEATLDFPRFALSDGRRLFIADGGNDRVLIYNTIPLENGARADVVLGQQSFLFNQASNHFRIASADALRTPSALAWDGTNLYVSDPFNRRILVFSPAERLVPNNGVRNAAAVNVFAVGVINFSGRIKADDEVTIKIGEKEYKYKIRENDSFEVVINQLVTKINDGEGDPHVFATPNPGVNAIVLTAREQGEAGNQVEISVSTSTGAEILGSTSGARLQGGGDAAQIAPFTLVTLLGDDLADETAAAPEDAEQLPTELGGVEVYFDGIKAPLLFVSPKQINAQIPVDVLDSEGINAYVRIRRANGDYSVTAPVAVPIVPQNPGIFTFGGEDPRPAVAVHSSSHATGMVSVDGSVQAGDIATVVIEDREYSYAVQEGDTLATIRDRLIELINTDEKVEARAAGVFTRIRLRARVEGPAGNGIPYSARANDGGQVILTPTGPALCCANRAGALITPENPALPGETIIVMATGLGIVKPDEARESMVTGRLYEGPELNEPNEFVSSLAGGKTANVLQAGLKPGTFGVYEVHLELNGDLPTNRKTQLTIAQDLFVSNIVTIPVFNPSAPDDDFPGGGGFLPQLPGSPDEGTPSSPGDTKAEIKAVVNGASFTPGVAPGGLISIFYDGIQARTVAAEGQWPYSLDDLTVTVNGHAVPLIYVSAEQHQINAQLPYEIAPGTATAVITRNGISTPPFHFEVQASAPGILLWEKNRAVAFNENGSLNAPGNGAAPGEVVTVYLLNIGATEPDAGGNKTNAAAPSEPLARSAFPHAAMLNAVGAEVDFLGLSPGWIGLAQANIRVPAVPPGDYDLRVMVGNFTSNPATITVR